MKLRLATHQNASKVFLAGTVLAASLMAGCSSGHSLGTPLPAVSAPAGAKLDPLRIVSEDNKLEFSLMTPGQTVSLDVSDLKVDFDCVDKYYWAADVDSSILRLAFIKDGCATLVPGKGTDEEKKYQAEADAAQSSTESPPPNNSQEAPPSGFLQWMNQAAAAAFALIVIEKPIESLSLMAAILGIGVLHQWLKSRKVRVILAGVPASGKTDFWVALDKDQQPNSGGGPTAGMQSERLAPLEMGSKVLYPMAVDTAGSRPDMVLDEIRGLGLIRRWRQKLVLVVVVSPMPGDQPGSSPAFDDQFIQQQVGYMSLPRALVMTKDTRKRPHAVILFASKFDLLSQHGPGDSDPAAERARREVQAYFNTHRQLVEGACREMGVPFEFVIGSAKRGWGIDEARKALWKSVGQ